MYPRNNATPPPVDLGEIRAIADNALQTSGASARVKTSTGWAAAGGTLDCDATSGCWTYQPTQAETAGEWLIVAAYKTDCAGRSRTLVFTKAAEAGEVVTDTASRTASKATGFAVAGDAMTLTSAYDAAKTAAQPGDEMALTGVERAAIRDGLATQDDVESITVSSRLVLSLPKLMERPDFGEAAIGYRMWLYTFDSQGQPADADSTPTVTAANQSGTDRSGNLGSVTKPAATTGKYYVDYSVADSHAIEQITIEAVSTVDAVQIRMPRSTMIVDTTAVDFTAADRAKLDALHDVRLTATRAEKLDNLDATITSRMAADGTVDANLIQIAGGNIISTGTQIAQAFSRFYNVTEGSGGTVVHVKYVDDLSEDSDGRRLTAKALEQAPAGEAGESVWSAGQRDQVLGYDATAEKQQEILTAIANINTGSGTGAYAVTVTVKDDDENPLQNATVRLRDGESGQSYVATTDVSGQASFSLDAATYTVTVTKALYSHTPETHAVTADSGTHSPTFTMSAVSIPSPSEDGWCTGYGYTHDVDGARAAAQTVYCQMVLAADGTTDISDARQRDEVSDDDGLVVFERLRIGATYYFRYQDSRNKPTRVTIDADDVSGGLFALPNFVG